LVNFCLNKQTITPCFILINSIFVQTLLIKLIIFYPIVFVQALFNGAKKGVTKKNKASLCLISFYTSSIRKSDSFISRVSLYLILLLSIV